MMCSFGFSMFSGEHDIGTFLLTRVLDSLQFSTQREVRAECLRMMGDWKIETKAENPKKIIEEYFKESESLSKDKDNRLETYSSIAKLADANYMQRRDYLDSSQFQTKQIIYQQMAHRPGDVQRVCY